MDLKPDDFPQDPIAALEEMAQIVGQLVERGIGLQNSIVDLAEVIADMRDHPSTETDKQDPKDDSTKQPNLDDLF